MKKRRTLIIALLLVAALCLGIGYAALSTRTLTLTGNASFNSSATHLNVNFVDKLAPELPAGNTSAQATASAAGQTASFNLNGLIKDEKATFTYIIENQHSEDISAKLTDCVESFDILLGSSSDTKVPDGEKDDYVTITHKTYKATKNTEPNAYTIDTSAEWDKTNDILDYGEFMAVVVEVTLTREPMELITITNYTLTIHFDPVYPQA